MIRVICLNPVIDRMYYIDEFQAACKFYEISPQIYVGGKGINIARVLSQMGQPCVLYGFVGGNNGQLVEAEMAKYHVEFRAFRTTGETRTTINIIDRKNRKETEITEPGIPVGEEEQSLFLNQLKHDLEPGDMVICSGIPMSGMCEDIYCQISRICQEYECKCVLDATGIYLKKSFPGQYYFSKPNFAEIAELFGKTENDETEILEFGKQMQKLGVENLLISMGENGGKFFDKDSVYEVYIPTADVISTIGSGDSTVAGFCLGTVLKMEKQDCVKLAMACGICNAEFSNVGYVEAKRVWELFKQIKIEKIYGGERK